ncbi:hypothetical protein KQI61_07950 [Anaerocolumna aminovalerica]|uniref:hypothetical protein n=1 Tax=Anaerocolumna aminovalerica TaxID=1527 RepID=UPI001C0EA1B1|nr:hypothetical protein [Anaerocolumna aminovalerica]MBU5332129.1 hypothetical protein [Anaerocolumna aminovalerica]
MDLTQYKNILSEISNGNTFLSEDGNSSTSKITIPSNNENLIFVVVNKTIQTPIALRDILVQGDKSSRKIHFVLHRYFDGVDLSDKDIFINYENAKSETGFDDNIENLIITEDLIEFDWWVNSQITSLEGKVTIQVEICKYDEVGDVIYRFQTLPCDLKIERTVISNGDAEPVDYYLDIKFLNEYSSPVSYNDMVSTTIPIDINNRTIVMPALEDIAVTQDSRSRLITFKIKRYIDNIDLSKKTTCIKYKLLNGTGDRSFVCNQSLTDTHLQFDWLLDSKVTSIEGKVEFAIEFIGYNEKNEFYCWNTLPSYIFISKGLDVDNIIEQPSASWIQSWNILAETYLRDYLKYVQQVKDSTEQAMKSAEEAILAMQKAWASAISADNDATISYNQANRSQYYSEQAKNSELITVEAKDTTLNALKEFNANIGSFRKKSEPIAKSDLTDNLQNEINNKVSSDDVRLKDVPITEADLSYELAFKINNGGGGSGGTPIAGAQIDDTEPSFSKVYSSQKTVNYVNTKIESAISGLEGLSDNNFTNAEKIKLAGIERNANYYSHPLTHPSSIITTTPDRDFISDVEKQLFADKYTKIEVDNMIAQISSGIIWKPEVPNFEDIKIKYPNPQYNWCVSCAQGTFLYNGSEWIKIGSGTIPLATRNNNGLLSSDDYFKLSQIEKGANRYVHPSSHSADMIIENSKKRFINQELYDKLVGLEDYTTDLLKKYRLKTDKILESDLDQSFLDKVANAGGTIINDAIFSTAQTYSSAKIEGKITEIKDIIDDVPTNKELDDFFNTLGL